MSKIEVTEEMVGRARDARANKLASLGLHTTWTDEGREAMRAALEAALNPPAEPEIPVSDGMITIGMEVPFPRLYDTPAHRTLVADIYRAMEFKRRQEAREDEVFEIHQHSRQGDKGPLNRFPAPSRVHRRKDDPK